MQSYINKAKGHNKMGKNIKRSDQQDWTNAPVS